MAPPSRLTVLKAALVVLLPALALLQYRWVGQLGDAARERMRRNLHNAAEQFRESFDGEVARALLGLQVDSTVVRDEAWGRYAERHAAWVSTTAYPKLVSNIYLIDAAHGELRLRRWDSDARGFAAAPWEGEVEAARAHFASELTAFSAGDRRPFERRPLPGNEGLLVAPVLTIHIGRPPQPLLHTAVAAVFGFTVIQLNLPLIREQLLPALARRHFTQTDDDAYRVAVVDAVNASRVIYRSAPDAPADPSRADVNVPMFGAHHDPVMFLAHGAGRHLQDAGGKRDLFVSVIREQRHDTVTTRARVATGAGGRWRLLAQHERGSLEAAVGSVRQRNLAVSFGILLLMGVSIGLLTLSSRRAQLLAQQQIEFVAGVSHELRTPVAVIRSAAENLSHGVVSDPDRVRRYGDAIEVEARRLGEMVERVLHFAGIESGRVVRRPVAVEPLIAEAVDAALAHNDGPFTVEREIAKDLPLVHGDAAALRSAIQNLVVNAIKYGGADRWVRVYAEAGREVRQPAIAGGVGRIMRVVQRERGARVPEVRITVEDRGRGIASSDLPHIFDPFYRGADATTRRVQGSGLGLALVRRIVQAHGGRVTVTTREGAGSAFTLHLPAAAATAVPVALQSHNEAAAG